MTAGATVARRQALRQVGTGRRTVSQPINIRIQRTITKTEPVGRRILKPRYTIYRGVRLNRKPKADWRKDMALVVVLLLFMVVITVLSGVTEWR